MAMYGGLRTYRYADAEFAVLEKAFCMAVTRNTKGASMPTAGAEMMAQTLFRSYLLQTPDAASEMLVQLGITAQDERSVSRAMEEFKSASGSPNLLQRKYVRPAPGRFFEQQNAIATPWNEIDVIAHSREGVLELYLPDLTGLTGVDSIGVARVILGGDHVAPSPRRSIHIHALTATEELLFASDSHSDVIRVYGPLSTLRQLPAWQPLPIRATSEPLPAPLQLAQLRSYAVAVPPPHGGSAQQPSKGRRKNETFRADRIAVVENELFVLCKDARRVVAVDATSGAFLREFGGGREHGSREGEVDDGPPSLKRPWDVAASEAYVAVADFDEQSITVFTRAGQWLCTFGAQGVGVGRFSGLHAVAVLGNLVYAADSAVARVQVFSAHDGTPVGEFSGFDAASIKQVRAGIGRLLCITAAKGDKREQAVFLCPIVVALLQEVVRAAHEAPTCLAIDISSFSAALENALVTSTSDQPDGPSRILLDEAEAMLQRARSRRQRAADGIECEFWFLRADKLRAASAAGLTRLPPFQQLRDADLKLATTDGANVWLELRTVTFEAACRGEYARHYCAVSHRYRSLRRDHRFAATRPRAPESSALLCDADVPVQRAATVGRRAARPLRAFLAVAPCVQPCARRRPLPACRKAPRARCMCMFSGGSNHTIPTLMARSCGPSSSLCVGKRHSRMCSWIGHACRRASARCRRRRCSKRCSPTSTYCTSVRQCSSSWIGPISRASGCGSDGTRTLPVLTTRARACVHPLTALTSCARLGYPRQQTQFEAWLSMQQPSAEGLCSAPAALRRCSGAIVCLGNSPPKLADALVQEWGHCTAQDAYMKLSSPDVTVTNQVCSHALPLLPYTHPIPAATLLRPTLCASAASHH